MSHIFFDAYSMSKNSVHDLLQLLLKLLLVFRDVIPDKLGHVTFDDRVGARQRRP